MLISLWIFVFKYSMFFGVSVFRDLILCLWQWALLLCSVCSYIVLVVLYLKSSRPNIVILASSKLHEIEKYVNAHCLLKLVFYVLLHFVSLKTISWLFIFLNASYLESCNFLWFFVLKMVISCSFNGGRQCWTVVGDAVGISKSLVYGFLDGFDVFFFCWLF